MKFRLAVFNIFLAGLISIGALGRSTTSIPDVDLAMHVGASEVVGPWCYECEETTFYCMPLWEFLTNNSCDYTGCYAPGNQASCNEGTKWSYNPVRTTIADIFTEGDFIKDDLIENVPCYVTVECEAGDFVPDSHCVEAGEIPFFQIGYCSVGTGPGCTPCEMGASTAWAVTISQTKCLRCP